jgi:hypothetical protein
MFRRSGAYSSYKTLLERRGLLEEWYDIEDSREEQALRKWCNGILNIFESEIRLYCCAFQHGFDHPSQTFLIQFIA